MPAASGPVFDRAFEPLEVDRTARQRRLRELGDLAGELTALAVELLVPVRRLQAAQAIGQHHVRQQAPHGAANQRAVDAFGEILLGRNAEAIGNHVDVGGRIAHFDAADRLLRRVPVADIIDLRQPGDAFVLPRAITKVVFRFSRARSTSIAAAKSERMGE